jgi:hypothetical protein
MGQLHSGPMAGRTVLVTGASGGIGRATALGLARMGADLAICGRDPESTEDAASELSAAGGGPVEVFVADCPPSWRCGAGPHGVFEGVQDQRGGHRGGCSPAGDPAGERIDHERDVDHPVPGRAIGEVGYPQPVRCCRRHRAACSVGLRRSVVTLERGLCTAMGRGGRRRGGPERSRGERSAEAGISSASHPG